MGTINVPDDSAYVNSSEIRWSLDEPPPPLECADLVGLEYGELFVYACELRQETTLLRQLLREALAQLHAMTRQVDRLRLRLTSVVEQLRTLRTLRRKASA